MPPGTAHVHSFVRLSIHLLVLSSCISFLIHSFIRSFIHAVHSPCQQVLLAFCSLVLVAVPPNRGCCSLHCMKQQIQSKVACLIHTAKLYILAKHSPCTHPVTTLHASRTHPALTLHLPHTHTPQTPFTHPAPILHPPRTHPAPTPHPPCTHLKTATSTHICLLGAYRQK